MGFDVEKVRADFPILSERINGKPLVYLDSANTSQKPRSVIDAMTSFMEHGYGPTNRSAYHLAAEATDRFEATRTKLARFVNARSASEIVFTKNATEALNLVVRSWGGANLGPGDAVVLTHMEHHANIVPWQMLAAEKGFEIRWVPLTPDGLLDTSGLDSLLDGAKAFSFTAMSNVLGTINPVADLVAAAHRAGAVAIVDGCQSVPHMPTDVQAWDADFMAFSSHKMVGPSGVGMLWAREEILEAKRAEPMMMNQLAWFIVDPEGGVKSPNLDLAMKAAEACTKADAKNGAYIDTMARVVFLKGDVARAIALQKAAIEKTPEGPMKAEMKKALAEYEAALKKA
jgi:cysteine desulfurase/selenocysteine lyase